MVEVGIFVGSVYGNAQHVAEQVEEMIAGKGHSVEVFTDPKVEDFKQSKSVVIVSSTTGQGDIPPNLEFFYYGSSRYYATHGAKTICRCWIGR